VREVPLTPVAERRQRALERDAELGERVRHPGRHLRGGVRQHRGTSAALGELDLLDVFFTG
jgi:hypothetical protein